MNWYQFDKIYIIGNDSNNNLHTIQNIAKNIYKITNLNNVEYVFNTKNKILEDIYDVLRNNKIIIDWYNTQYPGDFLGKNDLSNTLFMLNIINKSYLLGYNKIFIIDLKDNWNNFHNCKNFRKYIDNFPDDFNGFVLLDYKNKCDKIGKRINDYYYDSEWSRNPKDIKVYAISKSGMKNILDNQSMILKRFEYYLVYRKMCYDALVQHIVLDKK